MSWHHFHSFITIFSLLSILLHYSQTFTFPHFGWKKEFFIIVHGQLNLWRNSIFQKKTTFGFNQLLIGPELEARQWIWNLNELSSSWSSQSNDDESDFSALSDFEAGKTLENVKWEKFDESCCMDEWFKKPAKLFHKVSGFESLQWQFLVVNKYSTALIWAC